MPRSTRFAAAARPIGPAPMIATGSVSRRRLRMAGEVISTAVDATSMARYIDGCQYMGRLTSMTTPILLPVTEVAACCEPLTRGTLPASQAEGLARSLKALAH